MITDRIKFFNRSLSRSSLATATATAGGVSASNLLSEDVNTNWQGVALSDSTTESITINLTTATAISRILLRNHNLASYTITLTISNNGTISNARDINGTITTSNNVITVSGNSLDTNYFSFDEVTVSRIVIAATSTITANARKTIQQVISTTEIGTFLGYPEIKVFPFSMNEKITKTKTGLSFVNKQVQTIKRINLVFKNYTQLEDLELCNTLFTRENSFIVWPNGGFQEFRYQIQGFRYQDLYTMQTMGDFTVGLSRGSYSGVIEGKLSLVESI